MRHTRSPSKPRPTSAAALRSMAPRLSALCAKVYRAVLAAGSRGLTREQIERKTKISGNTVRPHCVTLLRERLLTPSGELRCTKSGHKAEVLIALVPA